jgi:hypothetical protein|tara:strand:- start:569 stop:1168 length:600 start_codon:yes stop_codon:yes gene_type:complete
MAISYPLTLPTATGIKSIKWTMVTATAYSESPFTFAGQTHAYTGERWEADITLPKMKRANAEQWISFLASLRGRFGSFLLNDPDATSPRGTATAATISGSAGDRTVSATVTSGDTLLAGDYIQLGTGSDSTLHKVILDFTGTGSAADLEIFPALRKTRSSVSADLTSASGLFRLSSNESSWDANDVSTYGITFGAVEVV